MRRLRRLSLILMLLGSLAVGGCFLFLNLPPVAAFTVYYNTVPGEPLVVVLDASSSSSPDGDEIEAYMWIFSKPDEGGEVEYYPQGYFTDTVPEPIITVKYLVEGEYTITLVVREKPRQVGKQGKDSAPVSQTITLPYYE